MRRIASLAAVVAVLASSCLFGGGGETRTILVDFSSDEFASFVLKNFPEKVRVRQGTRLVFRQTWTGEPHTVTGGTMVNEVLEDGQGWMRFFDAFDALASSGADLPSPEAPGDATVADLAEAVEGADPELREEFLDAWNDLRGLGVPLPDLEDPPDTSFEDLVMLVDEESSKAFETLPWAMDENDEDEFFITQNAGQPCYLTDGAPPEDVDTPCDEEEQEQPAFDGTLAYYNSGIIPFEGQGGNTFEVPLAEDIEPGSYWFYCAVHGLQQATEVEVVGSDTEVPSEAEVTRATHEEIDETLEPASRVFTEASEEGAIEIEGERLEGPFSGLIDPTDPRVSINEFVPKEMTVAAGEPISWKMLGADHTISFDVPEYFPIMEFLDDGTVRLNPKLQAPAGGAPDPPEEWGEDVPSIDGGTYEGEGFWSTGLIGAEPYLDYTLRISEPGTYRYACLIHPAMVGTVEVTA